MNRASGTVGVHEAMKSKFGSNCSWLSLKVFKTDLLIRNLPDLIIEPDLTQLQKWFTFMKKQYGHKIRFQTDMKHLTRNQPDEPNEHL